MMHALCDWCVKSSVSNHKTTVGTPTCSLLCSTKPIFALKEKGKWKIGFKSDWEKEVQ